MSNSPARIRIILAEDDPALRSHLGSAIAAEADLILIGSAANLAEGAALVARGGYDVLLCDLGLPDGSGIDLIRQSAARWPDADVLVVTMFADQDKVLASIMAGARGYVLKGDAIADAMAAIRTVRAGGSPISPTIARQLLRRIQPAPASLAPQPSPLSDRELELLRLLARGFSYAESAGLLGLSAHTVASHVKNIYRKLEVNSRAEALYEANALGLIQP
ncbi:MAG: response regulator transcription factor [Alphaproteobacteria bacterium]|nr:response regulator transcription factor [Alphaproteobacteria bacterium]